MAGGAEESLVRTNNRQWTASNRIEAEGLEWLYADPSAAKNNANQLEEYLLGKSIEGARGELAREDADTATAGSLLKEPGEYGTVDDTLSKFREDPLFIIKKVEMHQRQVMQKYEALARSGREAAMGRTASIAAPQRKHDGGNTSDRYRHSSRITDRSRNRSHQRSHNRSRNRSRDRSRHSSRRHRTISPDSEVDDDRMHKERRMARRDDSRHRAPAHNRRRRYSSSASSESSRGDYQRLGQRRQRRTHSSSYNPSESGEGSSDSSGRSVRDRRAGRRDSHRRRLSRGSLETTDRRRTRRRSTSSEIDRSHSRHRTRRDSPRRQRRRTLDERVDRDDRRRSNRDDDRVSNAHTNGKPLSGNSDQHPKETVKRRPGPELPKKKDTLKYAFAVTDDIMPPQAIQDKAEQKRREMEERSRMRRDMYLPKDDAERLEAMQSHGSEHLKERLQQMQEHDRQVQSKEAEEQPTGGDYISAVKQRAFESAKMAERIRQRAPRSLVEDA